MSRAWSFDLNYPRPPRGLSANDRAHRMVVARATANIREVVMYKVRALHVPVLDRARVDIEWVVTDQRRRDTDNVAPLLKAIYDGIAADKGVSAHILEDDAPQYMTKTGATIRYAKNELARFVITITDIGGDDV